MNAHDKLMAALEADYKRGYNSSESTESQHAVWIAYVGYRAAPPPLVLDATTATVIFNTLQDYANVCSYRGERTGGVLKGCPRGPKPTADKLVRPAQFALKRLELCRRLPEDKE